MFIKCLISVLVVSMSSEVASATSDWCAEYAMDNKTADKAIEICTGDIDSGKFTGFSNKGLHNLATRYNHRGEAYHYKGEFEKAIVDYSKAIELDKKYFMAYYNKGLAFEYKGDFDRAVDDYTKALEIDPNEGTLYFNRGNAYLKKNEYDKAIKDYNKAIEIMPNYPAASKQRELAYNKKRLQLKE